MWNGELIGSAFRSASNGLRAFTIHHSTFTIALLLLGCGVGEQASVSANPPRIVFATTVHDFGDVDQGSPLVHEFAFINQGGLDLSIDKLRSGCDCTATTDAERFIPPGAAGRVRVRCETHDAVGRHRRTVSVYANDPVQPLTVVGLVAAVRAAVAIAPSPFYVGRVHRGERVRRDGTIRWQVRPAGDVVAAGGAEFQVETSAPSGDRTEFSLIVNADAKVGPLDGRLFVRGADARPLRTVPVIGEIVSDVGVSPARILLAEPGTGQATSGSVLVHNAGPRAVRVTSAEWAGGTVAVDTLASGTRYRLTLRLEQPSGNSASELLIHTDHAEQPLLRVPVVVSAAAHIPAQP